MPPGTSIFYLRVRLALVLALALVLVLVLVLLLVLILRVLLVAILVLVLVPVLVLVLVKRRCPHAPVPLFVGHSARLYVSAVGSSWPAVPKPSKHGCCAS